MNTVIVRFSREMGGWFFECQTGHVRGLIHDHNVTPPHVVRGYPDAASAGDAARDHLKRDKGLPRRKPVEPEAPKMTPAPGISEAERLAYQRGWRDGAAWCRLNQQHGYRDCPSPVDCPTHRVNVL